MKSCGELLTQNWVVHLELNKKKGNQSSYSNRVENEQLLFIRFSFTAEENLLSQLLRGGSQKQCGGYEYCNPGRSQPLLVHPLLYLWPWQLEQE